jgi:maspardin
MAPSGNSTCSPAQVHLFGVSLGGFLAQKFAESTASAQRVQSLILCNTFADTAVFSDMPSHHLFALGCGFGGFFPGVFPGVFFLCFFSPLCPSHLLIHMRDDLIVAVASRYFLMPQFLLKRQVLLNFPVGELAPQIADSVDFVVDQLQTLSRESLASRLTLTTRPAYVEPQKIAAQQIKVRQRMRREVDGFFSPLFFH